MFEEVHKRVNVYLIQRNLIPSAYTMISYNYYISDTNNLLHGDCITVSNDHKCFKTHLLNKSLLPNHFDLLKGVFAINRILYIISIHLFNDQELCSTCDTIGNCKQ